MPLTKGLSDVSPQLPLPSLRPQTGQEGQLVPNHWPVGSKPLASIPVRPAIAACELPTMRRSGLFETNAHRAIL
jgi:hypothetical protein